MQALSFQVCVDGYKQFLSTCLFDRQNVFPTYGLQMEWNEIRLSGKDLSFTLHSSPDSLVSQDVFFPDGGCPFLDVNWRISFELIRKLPVSV